MNGFELFSPGHIIVLAICACLITGLAVLARRLQSQAARLAVIRALSVLALILEIMQDILLTKEGGNILNYLPLHLCNLGLFVNLAASFGRGKAQQFFAEVSFCLIAPGALFALITPEWNYRPLLSWLPINCFLTHTLLVAIPVMMLISGMTHPSFRHFHYPYVFLLGAAIPIYATDKAIDRNYMYLIRPARGSILEWFSSFLGNPGYILGVLALLAIILTVIYTACAIYRKAHRPGDF